MPVTRDDLLGCSGAEGWSVLLLLQGPAVRGGYYHSREGIGHAQVMVPYFRGCLGGGVTRELCVAVLSGQDSATSHEVIGEVKSLWYGYCKQEKPLCR